MLALHPEELRLLAIEALEPFYDHTLRTRTREAQEQWERLAFTSMQAHPAYQEALQKLAAAIEVLREDPTQENSEAFEAVQAEVAAMLAANIELPLVMVPPRILTLQGFPHRCSRLLTVMSLLLGN